MEKKDLLVTKREELNITRKEFSDALRLNKEQEKLVKLWETGSIEIPDDIYNRIKKFPTKPILKNDDIDKSNFKIIDLFAGIGGIRQAFQSLGGY
ncbi:MAG: hypothetical protein ACRC7N_12695, partial [Clostridium sp.]